MMEFMDKITNKNDWEEKVCDSSGRALTTRIKAHRV